MKKGTKNLIILASVLSVGMLVGSYLPVKWLMFAVFMITVTCGMVAHTESEGRMEERDKRIASEHR